MYLSAMKKLILLLSSFFCVTASYGDETVYRFGYPYHCRSDGSCVAMVHGVPFLGFRGSNMYLNTQLEPGKNFTKVSKDTYEFSLITNIENTNSSAINLFTGNCRSKKLYLAAYMLYTGYFIEGKLTEIIPKKEFFTPDPGSPLESFLGYACYKAKELNY